jgi:hypothetical protein
MYGAVPPLRTIVGATTGLSSPDGITVIGNELLVANTTANTTTVYALDAIGDIAPLRAIAGGATRLASPPDLAVCD